MKYLFRFFFLAAVLLVHIGCRKFVEAPLPTTEIVGSSVYSSNATAAAAVTGILTTMTGNSVGGGSGGISALGGLSADEFTLYPGAGSLQEQVYVNAQLSTNPPAIWSDLYNLIYQSNSAIAGINGSSGITPGMKQQLVGEAEFLRAFCYFYLVNLYGDVPLVLTPDYNVSEGIPRTAQAEVYAQIKSDLLAAQGLLSANYLTPGGGPTSERVRPNAAAAATLLARVYLYTGIYDSAEMEATSVINNGNYGLVMNLDSAFLPGNTEAIWQLENPNNGFNTPDGAVFLLGNFGGPSAFYPYVLSDSLEFNFESGDQRQVYWTDSIAENGTIYYYPYKYKLYYTSAPPAEYTTILRLAEVYLIRAEARAQQGDLSAAGGALSDLNTVRQRAGLAVSVASTQADVLAAIFHERRFELFTEYGHRWFDLRRSGTVNPVMSAATALKGGVWEATDTLYPIPAGDIKANTLLTQNPGYN